MSLELTILGSNSAAFAHNRHQTAQFLRVQNYTFLIDCGEGTQIQMKKYKVKASKINVILISHLHGDHYYGLTGLLSTMHLYGRESPLTLIGPPGLSEIIALQMKYSETELNFDVDFIEWYPGKNLQVYENDSITITTIPLDHRINCCGFLFKEKPKKRRIIKDRLPIKVTPLQAIDLKSGKDLYDAEGNLIVSNESVTQPPKKQYAYGYCSDTKYKEDIVEMISNVDLLYHEATFDDQMRERAAATFHSTAREAATIAKKAEAGKLLIGHFSTRYKDLAPLLEEARAVFYNTELAMEGVTFVVDY
ncbi:MAG TPA: ribonuclease Z [Cyclobacteriaceae bacterium]